MSTPPEPPYAGNAAVETSSDAVAALIRSAAIWFFALLISIAAAVITIQIVNANLYSPEKPIQDYFAAMRDGDGERALGLLRPQLDGSPALLTGEVLKRAASGVSDLELDNPHNLSNGQVKITANYQLNGTEQHTDFTVEPSGKQWLFFNRWQIVPDATPVLELSIVNSTQAQVNGVSVSTPGGKGRFAALYPGSYRMGLETKYFAAPAKEVLAVSPNASLSPVFLVTAPTEELTNQISAEVKTYLDTCTKQKVLKPTACPMAVTTQNRVTTPVTWRMKQYPQPAVSAYNGTWVTAPLAGSAEASYTEQNILSGATQDTSQTSNFIFGIKLHFADDTVKIEPFIRDS